MPNLTQPFTITNGNVVPNGNGAQMSKSGSNSQPNQAQWHSADNDYTIGLPSSVWVVPTTDPTYTFTVSANKTSLTYSLRSDATTGPHNYSVSWPSTQGGNSNPSVVVNP
jgi:hypothetical protein